MFREYFFWSSVSQGWVGAGPDSMLDGVGFLCVAVTAVLGWGVAEEKTCSDECCLGCGGEGGDSFENGYC